jgi:tetratricopeptide (TPR) repeat protein
MNPTLAIVIKAVLSLLGLALLIWLFCHTLKRSNDPAKILFKELLTIALVGGELFFIRSLIGHLGKGLVEDSGPAALISGSIAICGIILSIMWTSQISDFLFSPLTNLFDGGHEPPEPKPYYSIAMAKQKQGHPLEAIVELRAQLAKFPNDFEGVLLLAGIQAGDMNDLPGAEITLNHFCDSPHAPDRQVVAALTQLADWELKLAQDVDGACIALQKIVTRFPNTEFSLQAEQRLAHLGGTEKILMAAHDRQAVEVPEGVKNIGLLDSSAFLNPKETQPGQVAAGYVKHLEQHPHDAEVREKLAGLYAKDFHRLDLATLELSQLINEPKHAPKQVVHWLNLLAGFQIELGADVPTVRATLEKIAERFPNLPQAEIVRRRLALLNSEFKGQEKTPGVSLGVYEQNIGLKQGPPRNR